MAKKVKYIKGSTDPQKFSDGKKTVGVTGFWHIQAPRSKQRTLCGLKFPKIVDTTTKRPKEGARSKELCTFCERISDGRHPVFDSYNESHQSSRKPEDIGTRANPSRVPIYARGGEVIA